VEPVRTNISEEHIASIIRATRFGKPVTANVVRSSAVLVTLMMDAIRSSDTSVLKQSHGVASQKTAFFIVTAVKISNLT
jgi:hypothetical protein